MRFKFKRGAFANSRFARAVKLKLEPTPAPFHAEGVGFEPTVTFLPRSISSRVPSTGLSHPSYIYSRAFSRVMASLRGARPAPSPKNRNLSAPA
jgi:hypothetical protein